MNKRITIILPLKKLICLFLFFLLCSAVKSQNSVSLSGKITDANSGGIANASVYLLNTNIGTVTATEGDFTIENIPAGNYIVHISAIGFATVTRNISLTDNKSGTLNVQLNN